MQKASPKFETEKTLTESPAFWLYTSGTEGKAKGVIHAHRSIPAHDDRSRLWQNLKSDDVVFNTSALNWSYALTCGLLDLWRSGVTTLVYEGSLQADPLFELIRRYGVTVFMSVPGIYKRIVDNLGSNKFQKVRVCLSAGEKLIDDLRKTFHQLTGLAIHEGLGMTEHSVYLIQKFGTQPVYGSCGQPVPNSRIAILRDDLTEAKLGEVGLLASHKSCEGLMLGYHQRDAEEKRMFRGDWFIFDDFVYCDEEGNYYYVGRSDDVITAGGYRISPIEVEAVLNQHPAVLESAVVGWEIEAGKTIVKAYVVLNKGMKLGEDLRNMIMEHAGKNLAQYKIPREIHCLDEIPKTTNGKIKRKQLGASS